MEHGDIDIDVRTRTFQILFYAADHEAKAPSAITPLNQLLAPKNILDEASNAP